MNVLLKLTIFFGLILLSFVILETEAEKEHKATPTPTSEGKSTPGFKAMFAIAGLLSAVYMLRRWLR